MKVHLEVLYQEDTIYVHWVINAHPRGPLNYEKRYIYNYIHCIYMYIERKILKVLSESQV